MRGARWIVGLTSICGFACAEPLADDAQTAAAETLKEQLTLFFPMNESEGAEHFDRVNQLTLVSWQRTGFGAYAVDEGGTTAVPGAVGAGQHIAGAKGFHFAMYTDPALDHEAGSFTWAGWMSVDAADGDSTVEGDQTWLAKWNGIPDTPAAVDHREYRIWHDHALSRLRFEVSADGLEGDEHSKVVTHSTPIERGELYFIEAWHDADKQSVNLRVSTQRERGELVTEAWSGGVFAGDADLDVGAQNTCTDAHLQGLVDALGHWKRVLSDAESRALWNHGAGLEPVSD
jgi:vacuolar-type H+-ATPase catalytic subunit A/Vma1